MPFFNENEDYTAPASSGKYMRFEDGVNRFRILGSFAEGTAIHGRGYWVTGEDKNRKPIRKRMNEDIPVSELEINKYGNLDKPKYFWALPVWNYSAEAVQILEINQKQILDVIKKMIDNPKWGDPREYDIIVHKGKEGDRVVYSTTVDPKEEISAEVLKAYADTKINIEALFDGQDPYTV